MSVLRPGTWAIWAALARIQDGLLEDVEDGPPVDARALHRHVRDAVGFEPIPERQQIGCGSAEHLHVLSPVPVRAGHPHADRHRLLVNIQTRTSLEDLLHRRTSRRECVERTQEHPRHDFARRARRQQCGVPEAPPSVYVRTRGTDRARRRGSCARRAVSIADFHGAGWAEGPCRFMSPMLRSSGVVPHNGPRAHRGATTRVLHPSKGDLTWRTNEFCVSITHAKDNTDTATVSFVVANAAAGSSKETQAWAAPSSSSSFLTAVPASPY